MFRTTLLLPGSLEAWPQHVVGAALISCSPSSTWAQKWLAELLPLTKGAAEELMSSTAVPQVAVLKVQHYRGGLAPLLSSWPCISAAFLDLGVLGACQMATEQIQLTNPKENHVHVTLSPLAGRRGWGDLEANSFYFAIRCCNTCGYCMLHSVARVPWAELIEFGL